jgi:hypothetical protein
LGKGERPWTEEEIVSSFISSATEIIEDKETKTVISWR